jgi:hypothetical protein
VLPRRLAGESVGRGTSRNTVEGLEAQAEAARSRGEAGAARELDESARLWRRQRASAVEEPMDEDDEG